MLAVALRLTQEHARNGTVGVALAEWEGKKAAGVSAAFCFY
jgi:hypothetical protein